MLSKYRFKGLDAVSSFYDYDFGSIYFPILDSGETPIGIMKKTEQIIDELLHVYRITHGCRMEVSGLYMTATVNMNPRDKRMGISVKISDYDSMEDHVAEKKFSIWRGSPLYGQFKSYFMAQLEKELFGD